MHPMPSGGGGFAGELREGGEAAGAAGGGGAEIDDLGRAEAMDETGGAGASLAFGGARAGAQAAMHPEAAVGHGRLAAAAAEARARTAARGCQIIAGGIALLQLATALT